MKFNEAIKKILSEDTSPLIDETELDTVLINAIKKGKNLKLDTIIFDLEKYEVSKKDSKYLGGRILNAITNFTKMKPIVSDGKINKIKEEL